MSILSGPAIDRLVRQRNRTDVPPLPCLSISPFDPSAVGPNSYDVTLAPDLLVYRLPTRVFERPDGCKFIDRYLDPEQDNPTEPLTIPTEGLVLQPGILYLGSTVEAIEAHRLVPVVETRSSFARLGLSTHLSAGFCDDGFAGSITLEITVACPLLLKPFVRVAQVAFHTLEGERKPYAGKYTGQRGPVASRSHLEAKR